MGSIGDATMIPALQFHLLLAPTSKRVGASGQMLPTAPH
jgi:hypothetical protein